MILQKIAEATKLRVAKDKQNVSLDDMKQNALNMPKGSHIFANALKQNYPAIISEVKKASPSKGVIAEHFPYVDIALEYEKAGATCISVLTEPKWFLGSDNIFTEIRAKVHLPMIRKDFTIDEYQIYQAKVMGADAILLICALLDTDTIKRYIDICNTLGIDVLVEAHDEAELKSAINAGAKIIGVNNRNLHDFSVNIENATSLKQFVPEGTIFVAESGVSSVEDAITMAKNGADALLIGEALMRTDDKGKFIADIKRGVNG